MKSIYSMIAFAIAVLVSWPAFAADTVSQPLTGADCEKAGMHWDDSANVCASNQGGSTQAVAPKAETSTKSKAASKPAKAPEITKPSKKKKVSAKKSTRKAHYNKPQQTRPADHRPLRWLFPNANKKTGAS
jgi:hypothetical protein